jgi:hypothetical protein
LKVDRRRLSGIAGKKKAKKRLGRLRRQEGRPSGRSGKWDTPIVSQVYEFSRYSRRK